METQNCLLCGKLVRAVYSNISDTRFGIHEQYIIGQCSGCNLLQTIPRPTLEQLTNLYNKYYNFGGERNTVYTKLREWLFSSMFYRLWLYVDGDISFHNKKGSGRLLDYGCNEGRGLQLYKRNGFDSEGIELNSTAAEVARSKGFTVYTSPIEQFQPEELYDVVVLSNVLEHFLNPRDTLKHINRILKPEGDVWISCPNVGSWFRYMFKKTWINWHIPFHLVHFQFKNLNRLLSESGFKVITHKQKTPALWVASSFITAIFARQGKPTNQLRNPLLIIFLIVLIRGFFFPVLWILNMVKFGDCIIVRAKKIKYIEY